MSVLVDSSRARERACAIWLLAVMLVLSACGDKFTANGAELGSAGDAGGELAAGAAGLRAVPPSGGDGGLKTTTTSAGAADAPNGGAAGSTTTTVPAAGAGASGAATSGGAGAGGSCLAGWKGSKCDQCAGLSSIEDRAACSAVVDCCESKHLDCHGACTTCGCGFAFDQPASEVFTCMCGAS